MKVTRTVVMDTNKFELGDTIEFKLKNGYEMKAMAVESESDGTVFLCMTHLFDTYPMDDSGYCGYERSYLRMLLNKEIVKDFPEELNLVPFYNGDYLRIPTSSEIYGGSDWGSQQWKPFKEDPTLSEKLEYSWLQDSSSACSSAIGEDGIKIHNSTFSHNNVYPVFKLAM